MSARKPVLPAYSVMVSDDGNFGPFRDTEALWRGARAELRAAESVIRAARYERRNIHRCHKFMPRDRCDLCRALARLDALRGTR